MSKQRPTAGDVLVYAARIMAVYMEVLSAAERVLNERLWGLSASSDEALLELQGLVERAKREQQPAIMEQLGLPWED